MNTYRLQRADSEWVSILYWLETDKEFALLLNNIPKFYSPCQMIGWLRHGGLLWLVGGSTRRDRVGEGRHRSGAMRRCSTVNGRNRNKTRASIYRRPAGCLIYGPSDRRTATTIEKHRETVANPQLRYHGQSLQFTLCICEISISANLWCSWAYFHIKCESFPDELMNHVFFSNNFLRTFKKLMKMQSSKTYLTGSQTNLSSFLTRVSLFQFP